MPEQTPAVVDTEWLQSRLNDPTIRIIDATTQLKHASADGYYSLESGRAAFERQHIPGAVFADVLYDFADANAPHSMTVPSSEQFEKAIGALGVSNETHVIVYDQLDMERWPEYYPFWASRLWWHLRLEGHTKVSVLEGGLGKWKGEGRAIATGATKVDPAMYVAHRRPELLATIDEVAAAIDSDRAVLINVLNDDTFSGRQQVYARPGHIPSSKHVFFGKVIDIDTGRYRATEEVRPLFEEIGALETDKKPIVYCGSGIAATIVALQLARVGREDTAVYDGSMTEWASDESRPLILTP
ncbi:sulfurtransferase [Agrobacterium tumefaciens]|uniref:sulfurtransferase n=1 Tax=Agrobacterium tumefaciens TaxID=358 RepID=UPI0012B857FA|nr:sulfurtransferase [Agrobacterium tumefaciens]MQB07916.1 sulfurtransferase [Agrobacterium tumefaciens]